MFQVPDPLTGFDSNCLTDAFTRNSAATSGHKAKDLQLYRTPPNYRKPARALAIQTAVQIFAGILL